ncbi:hypothetical protein C1645_833137 [Glomus cerebriforme]|uniref:Uncharacterized protein n=1 Tax=Glomus cerebriforme TaxID=658196 RepID=A0A397SG73_9GLOM|nr:hypothetical protein C1645_833137 [Glomus cerebriforme]
MAIKLYEQNDNNLQEFDKNELLSILVQNGYHSIEQSDSEDETRQKLPDNKRFLHLKYLLRDVLDPAAEEIQHAKKQRERIYDDDTYFTYSKPPENTPEWAYDAEKIRNEATDVKMLEYRVNNNNDKMTQYDDASLTDPNLNYLLNSAEMNLIWPKDLDEIGESSQSESKGEKKADPEEETIDAIFNAEVDNVIFDTKFRELSDEIKENIQYFIFCGITDFPTIRNLFKGKFSDQFILLQDLLNYIQKLKYEFETDSNASLLLNDLQRVINIIQTFKDISVSID